MKTLFVVNPVAGRGKCLKIWNNIKYYIKFPFDFVFTQAPGEAAEIAAGARNRGFTRVVAVGGDGTICEVGNGLALSDVEMGIIPAGTGNDFIRTIGIPQDPKDALAVLEQGHTQYIDLGRHEKGFFINVAGVGLDAEVARATNEDVKFLSGTPAYIFALITTLIHFSPRKAVVEVDGKTYHRKLWLAAVGNASFYGGGMMICPDALVDDGLLEVCLVNDMSRLEILRFLPRVFSGGHKSHPAFEVFRGKQVKISFEIPTAAHADGDCIGCTPVSFSIMPRALKVIGNNFTHFRG